MQNLNDSITRIFLPHRVQQTDSHCGPAVLQSLFDNVNFPITQDQIVDAAGIKTTILEEGTRPYQLALAVARLAPNHQFWFKQYACRHDLETMIRKHHWPVALNWQGLFYDSVEEEEEENPEGDHGHYSVVIDVDLETDKIVIADPYEEYSNFPRTFSLTWFEQRWWDVADDVDPLTGVDITTRTDHLMFTVTPRGATFPQEVGMMLPDKIHLLTDRE